jgi:hypothetical protein
LTTIAPALYSPPIMRRWRQVLQRGGALLFVVLTLVPLAVSGHYHPTPHASAPASCALCVAVHHAPAAQSSIHLHVAPILQLDAIPAQGLAALIQVFRPFAAGRAPPHWLRLA